MTTRVLRFYKTIVQEKDILFMKKGFPFAARVGFDKQWWRYGAERICYYRTRRDVLDFIKRYDNPSFIKFGNGLIVNKDKIRFIQIVSCMRAEIEFKDYNRKLFIFNRKAYRDIEAYIMAHPIDQRQE